MQEIESVIDEPHFALAVGRCLRLREAWQSGVVDATKLAIDIGGLHVDTCKRSDGARIFVRPVKPGPRQQLNTSTRLVEEHGDAKLTDLLQTLADCPKARSASIYDRCRAVYEGLTAR